MAILAMRERRRCNQLRRLGVTIPIEYVRIYSLVRLAKKIQMELVRYRSAIEDDSEYEDDENALEKYRGKFAIYSKYNRSTDRVHLAVQLVKKGITGEWGRTF